METGVGEQSSFPCQPKIELPQQEAETVGREVQVAFPPHPWGEITAL